MPSLPMTTPVRRRQTTERDHQILTALDFSPLTARQVQYLSSIWPRPFGSLRKTRERLQELTELGLLQIERYAALAPGQPENYYFLTRAGFALLRGPDERPPTKGYFSPIGISRQAHTKALADFLVHAQTAAHRSHLEFTDFYRENTLKLTAGSESVYPDASFVLSAPDRRQYRFFVEIDFGTERLRSSLTDATWERKARVYDHVQDNYRQTRFRVLVISARDSHARLENMLAIAVAEQRNRERSLFLTATLSEFLAAHHAVTAPIFSDQRADKQSLVSGGLFEPVGKPESLPVHHRAATVAPLPVRV
jgi:Replication-relaxation